MNHYDEHAVWIVMTKFVDYISVYGVYLTKESAEKDLKISLQSRAEGEIEAWIEGHEVIA